MIPPEVHWPGVLDELNRLGIIDSHIEILCNFSEGYVRQLRHKQMEPSYKRGTKLMNLLDKEMKDE